MTLYSISWRSTVATLCALVASALSTQIAQGTTYTFQNPANLASVSWQNSANWNPTGVPSTADDAAVFVRPTVSPSEGFSILLDEATTIASITIDSTGFGSNHSFTIDGSPLTFSSNAGSATYTETVGTNTTGRVTVWNNIDLQSDLIGTFNLRSDQNTSSLFNGLITGTSSRTITKEGDATLQLSHHAASGFAGQYIINNGGVRFTGSSNLVQSSGVTVNAGGQLQFNAADGSATYDWNLGDGAVLHLNGLGRSGLAGALRFQGAAGNPATHSKFHSPVDLQSDARIGIGPATVTGELTNVVSGDGGLIKNGPGTLILSNAGNSYLGSTTIEGNAGTLSIMHPILEDDADVLFLADNSFLNLNFDGTDIIQSLFIAGEQKLSGIWGATGNASAEFTTDRITGNGLLDVRVGPGIPGDYNDDGFVNAADYVLWRDTMSDQPEKYDEWKANFGAGSPGSGAEVGTQAAVPEPTALLLGLVAVCGWVIAIAVRAKLTA